MEAGPPRHLGEQQVVQPPPLPPATQASDQQCQPQVRPDLALSCLTFSTLDPRLPSRLARCTLTINCTVSDPTSNPADFLVSRVTMFRGASVTAQRVFLYPHHWPATPDTGRWVERPGSCLEKTEANILRSSLQTLFVGKPPRNSPSSRFQCNHKVVSLDISDWYFAIGPNCVGKLSHWLN